MCAIEEFLSVFVFGVMNWKYIIVLSKLQKQMVNDEEYEDDDDDDNVRLAQF